MDRRADDRWVKGQTNYTLRGRMRGRERPDVRLRDEIEKVAVIT